MSDYKLSIVLPCYNEARNIPLILERFRDVLRDQEDIEVLLVDNGSTDNSLEIFKAELAKSENSFASLFVVEVNKGYGFGIMSGVREATGEVIAWTHADMQTDPRDVIDLYEKHSAQIINCKAYGKGRRINRNILDTFFTWGMSVFSSFQLGIKLDDINGQPKMFHRSFRERLVNAPADFSLDLYLMYKAHERGDELLTIPVSFEKRIHGESKGGGTLKGKYKLIKRTFAYIYQLKREIKKGLR